VEVFEEGPERRTHEERPAIEFDGSVKLHHP